MKKRWFLPEATFANGVAALVIMALMPVPYWAILDRQPAADSVSEMTSDHVKQGGLLQIRYKLTWRNNCTITAYRYIVDNMRIEWPISAESRRVQKGPAEFTVNVPIPLAASPGKATYRGTLLYECNPIQRFFPLEQALTPRTLTIDPGDNAAGGVVPSGMGAISICPDDKPQFVRAYCRRKPALTLIAD